MTQFSPCLSDITLISLYTLYNLPADNALRINTFYPAVQFLLGLDKIHVFTLNQELYYSMDFEILTLK